MKWIFIDFGTFQTKLLKASVEGQRVFIEGFHTLPSKPDHFRGLGFPDGPAWAAATIALNEQDWLSAEEESTVLSALPSTYLETRYLNFPIHNEKKIEKILAFELEASIPFDIEEIQIRSRLLTGEGVNPKRKDALVLAYTYKREPIRSFETELRKFQLSIPPIGTEILNLSSLSQAIREESLFGILEVGHSTSKLVIMQRGGQILGLRSFWWGGKTFLEALAAKLQVDAAKANEILLNSDPQKLPLEEMYASFSSFCLELRQSMKGMESAGLVLPKPLPIYCLGVPTRLPRFFDSFNLKAHEIHVDIKAFPTRNIIGRQIQGLELLEDVDKALPALSMALAQLRTVRGKIPSFSESSFQFQRNLKKLKSSSFSILRKVALILIVPLIYAIINVVVLSKENKVAMSSLQKGLETAGFQIGKNESTDETLTKLKKLLAENRKKIDQLSEDADSPLMVLSQVSASIPSNLKIDVKEFRVSAANAFISAETNSTDTANQIAEALRKLYPKLKMGAINDCPGKKSCKFFNMEFERESKT